MTYKQRFSYLPADSEFNNDPYLTQFKPEHVMICTECRSVYANGRWELESQAKSDLAHAKKVEDTVCPACRKIRDRMPGGIVTISGGFIKDHEQELVNLIHNENQRAMEVNPLERVMDIEMQDSCLVVLTTNEALAQRIGRALHKSYSGQVEYKWSKGNKLARVNWHRA